ncbi:acyl-CoA dehydrogenase family protein [uncultured Pseudacidovorax sp.]|uniref:acyl-CoA dehydrogenase family protein n=1 Tax=uncultured Pseudacidovorax sp. TaxID=679313 RepID=UPI0025DB14CA|nr:acyl-CoA dehydrogenase family protein [uncultured Pseudacidovorax sp.]
MSSMDTRNEFHDAADRLFGDLATPDVLESAEAGVFPKPLWDAVSASGFTQVLVPEARGGVGGSLADGSAVLLAAGAHAVPGPLLETMLGNGLLAAAGLASCEQPMSLAFTEAAASDRELVVRGVPWTEETAKRLVVARRGAKACLGVLGAGAGRNESDATDTTGEPCGRIVLSSTMDWHPLEEGDFDAWLRRAALLRGAQMLGAMRWCLERTTAYTLERRQFGREIAKFQAVQQMMAEMASAFVASQAMLDAAIAAADRPALVAAARSRLGDAADIVCGHAHQVHGAIGFSYEYVLHFRTRRLMAWRDQFGTVAHWRRVLARQFVGRSADEVWPAIAD